MTVIHTVKSLIWTCEVIGKQNLGNLFLRHSLCLLINAMVRKFRSATLHRRLKIAFLLKLRPATLFKLAISHIRAVISILALLFRCFVQLGRRFEHVYLWEQVKIQKRVFLRLDFSHFTVSLKKYNSWTRERKSTKFSQLLVKKVI